MKRIEILISGKQGSGKTTLANNIQKILLHKSHTGVTQNPFAKIIYEMHDEIRRIGDEYGIPRVEPKDGPLLQLLGTEWGRSMDPNIWVKATKVAVDRIHESRKRGGFKNSIVIIPDLRFENEFLGFSDALKIRLECPKHLRKERVSMWRDNDEHQSEVDLDQYAKDGNFDRTYHTAYNSSQSIASEVVSWITPWLM